MGGVLTKGMDKGAWVGAKTWVRVGAMGGLQTRGMGGDQWVGAKMGAW